MALNGINFNAIYLHLPALGYFKEVMQYNNEVTIIGIASQTKCGERSKPAAATTACIPFRRNPIALPQTYHYKTQSVAQGYFTGNSDA